MYRRLLGQLRSAVHHVNFIVEDVPPASQDHVMLKVLRFHLRNLKMFVLSTQKLENDASVESFLVKMEEAALRIAKLACCVRVVHGKGSLIFSGPLPAVDYEEDLNHFEEQAAELYVTLLDTTRESRSLSADQVFEIINSAQENLLEFRNSGGEYFIPSVIKVAIEASGWQMAFLDSLMRFALRTSFELKEDFLAHVETAAIYAAYLLCKGEILGTLQYEKSVEEEVVFKISTLIQKLKPINPQVYNTYSEALSSLKSAALLPAPTDQGMDDGVFNAIKNLLHSLMSILQEALELNNHALIPAKDKLQELYEGLQELYEGLRSLTTKLVLKQQQPDKFEVKMKEHIGPVVCDAGVLIFSLYQKHEQLDLGLLQALLEAIKTNLAELQEKYPLVPACNLRNSTQLAFADFVLEKLTELASGNIKPIAKAYAQSFQEKLIPLRSFLGEIKELRHDHEELHALWDRILEVLYAVEDIIDNLLVSDFPDSVSALINIILEEVSDIQSKIKVRRPEINLREVNLTLDQVQSTTPSVTKETVGFDDHALLIINQLNRRSEKLRIVTIVGMPGLGKTTLAEKVYDDSSVSTRFPVRAFTTVSHTCDKKKVLTHLLKQVLKQVSPKKDSEINSDTTARDVAEKLWRSLRGRKYLIVLDNIWEAESWDSLKEAFPDDHKASRILFTSRYHDAAPPDMLDEQPYELRPFTKTESLALLQRLLFGGNNLPTTELTALGLQIAEICGGLPLTIVIVAGVLESKRPEEWKKILDSLSSGKLSERCRDTLELSYRNLPEYLKPCFLYCALLQENGQVSVRRLLHLWMAEGFVRKVEMRRLSDVAEEYLNGLLGRSLLMVAEQRTNGKVRSCRFHDLVHEFCLQKAKDEQFFYSTGRRNSEMSTTVNEPHNLRRLWIHSDAKHFMEANVHYCSGVRSVHFNPDEEFIARDITLVISICKLLRVLDLEHICLNEIPREIGQIVQLVYLAIGGCQGKIPASIGNLYNLETFTLMSDIFLGDTPSLPPSFWNLRKLKHFYIMFTEFWCVLPVEHLDRAPELSELDRISGVILPHDWRMQEAMKKFPNIRKLKCKFQGFDDCRENLVEIVVPDFLKQLESLHMAIDQLKEPEGIMFEFGLPSNLKKLALTDFLLSGKALSIIGKLPILEVLKLNMVRFEGGTWRMEEKEFPNLRFLRLDSQDLRWWSASESDDQFGCLETLEIQSCDQLMELPSCLGTILMLQTVEVIDCPGTVVELVKGIEQEQVDNGNVKLKIIIGTSDSDLISWLENSVE